MLFSMFISYHLVRRFSSQTYAVLMACWVIVASLLTIFLARAWILALFLLPFMLLSFPFFSTVEQLHSYTPITAYNIQFFTLRIASISPENAFVYGFSFFALVNLIGAVLGNKINKILLEKSLKRNLFDFFLKGTPASLAAFYLFMVLFYFALGIITQGYRVNHYLNDNILWFTIMNIVYFLTLYFFWVPALIATIIYGIYERSKNFKISNRTKTAL